MLEQIPILIKKPVTFLIIIVNKILLVILIHIYALILQVSDKLLDMADIMREAKELYDVFELTADVDDLLGEVLGYLGQDVVFLESELKEQLETAQFGVLIYLVDMFVLYLFHHLVVDFLYFLQHFMESWSFLGVVSQHKVGEILPIRMYLTVILNSTFSYLIKSPLFLKIFVSLKLYKMIP